MIHDANTDSINLDSSVIFLQRQIRSSLRYDLHEKIFNKPPDTVSLPAAQMVKCLEPSKLAQVLKIINRLAGRSEIIPKELIHVTTWSNLWNICREGAILGAEFLKNNNIQYDSNCLCEDDVTKYGDGNTICFAPNLVDYDSLVNVIKGEEVIRKQKVGAIILHLDISKINTCSAKYFQFFKLRDYLSPNFKFSVKISDEMNIGYEKWKSEYRITINLKGQEKIAVIDIHNNISYGNIYEMNRFCMISLFKTVESIQDQDPSFIQKFYDYISSRSKLELIKIIKLYSQHLISFAEFNFYGKLNIPKGFITSITDVESLENHLVSNYETQELFRLINNYALDTKFMRSVAPCIFDKNGRFSKAWGKNISLVTRSIFLSNADYSNLKPDTLANKNSFPTNYFMISQNIVDSVRETDVEQCGICLPHYKWTEI